MGEPKEKYYPTSRGSGSGQIEEVCVHVYVYGGVCVCIGEVWVYVGMCACVWGECMHAGAEGCTQR